MARGDRSLHPHRPVRGGQVHGYAGVATDAAGDLPRPLGLSPVVVPGGAVTPLTASGQVVPVDGSGVALPDPAEAPDGQVPTTVAGAYGLSVGAVQAVTRTLTSAEILALFTSPIELVPGQVGKIIWPFAGLVAYRRGTVDYVWTNVLEIDGAGVTYLNLDPTVLNGFSVGAVLPSLAASFALAGEVGAPIIVADSVADPTDGDGEIDLVVLYRVVDVS